MRFRVSAARQLFSLLCSESPLARSGDVSLGMAPEPSLGQTCIRLEISAHQRRRIQLIPAVLPMGMPSQDLLGSIPCESRRSSYLFLASSPDRDGFLTVR